MNGFRTLEEREAEEDLEAEEKIQRLLDTVSQFDLMLNGVEISFYNKNDFINFLKRLLGD